jgi:anti-sigma B factor antagonist
MAGGLSMTELLLDVRMDGESGARVVVGGEVDMETAPQLAECLRDHQNMDVVVDLSRVTFLDASAVNVLVQAYNSLRAAGHRLRTTGERDHVLKVIEICGLAEVFHAQ